MGTKKNDLYSVRVYLNEADQAALDRATLIGSVVQNRRLTPGDYLLSLFHQDQAAKNAKKGNK